MARSAIDGTDMRLSYAEYLDNSYNAVKYVICRLLEDYNKSVLEKIKEEEFENNFKAIKYTICRLLDDHDNSVLDKIKEGELENGRIEARLLQLEIDNNLLLGRLTEMEIEMERLQLESHDAISQKQVDLDDCKANMESIIRVVVEQAGTGNGKTIRATLDDDYTQLPDIVEQTLRLKEARPPTELLRIIDALEVKVRNLRDCKANMESIIQVVVEEGGHEETIRAVLDENYTQLAVIVEQTLRLKGACPPTELLQTIDALEDKVQELEDNVESEREKLTCRICYDNERNVVCLPCKHFLFCSLCLPTRIRRTDTSRKRVDRCPVCQISITGVLPVYR